jgi:hypothetical protein
MSAVRIVAASLLLVCALSSTASAQQFTTAIPGTFIDLSTSGGTAITGVTDDSTHAIITTVANGFFSAGTVTVGNNGACTSMAAGAVPFTNNTIPAAPANPAGIGTGAGILMPFWDDLYPQAGAANTTIWWQEVSGVLYIMWKDDNHFADTSGPGPGPGITFEIQVFNGASGPCTPYVQFLYADTNFSAGFALNDNGLSATVGYAHGTLAGVNNSLWGYLTSSVSAGMVLSLIEGSGGGFTLTPTSPFGPGSLQLDFANGFPCAGGTYIMAVTLSAGSYPSGWLYGVDIPYAELVSEYNTGYPFVGPLAITGTAQIGPFGGGALPSGLTFYAVGLGIPYNNNGSPTIHTAALSYTIP